MGFENTSWGDGWPAPVSPQPARQAIVNDTRTTVQHFYIPPQPPPPAPPPQIVYARPVPVPPKADDLLLAGLVFGIGVFLIAIVTGFSVIWFAIVAVFLGIVGLISGFALFISWIERFSNSRR